MVELTSLKITDELLRAIVGIFVIVDPIGSVGIFLAVTNGFSKIKKEKAARFAGITVAAVLVVAALMGQAILDLFGIRLAAFSVAGGILFLILAVEMIRGEGVSQFHKLNERSEQLPAAAIVPLGVPLMAGPGAISTVILASPGSANWFETAILISSIAVLGLVTWLCFSYAQHIGKLIGDIGIQLISRIMGLILAALAVEYVVKGVQILFKLQF
jgi:multiple antibiotic resistance protein